MRCANSHLSEAARKIVFLMLALTFLIGDQLPAGDADPQVLRNLTLFYRPHQVDLGNQLRRVGQNVEAVLGGRVSFGLNTGRRW